MEFPRFASVSDRAEAFEKHHPGATTISNVHFPRVERRAAFARNVGWGLLAMISIFRANRNRTIFCIQGQQGPWRRA